MKRKTTEKPEFIRDDLVVDLDPPPWDDDDEPAAWYDPDHCLPSIPDPYEFQS